MSVCAIGLAVIGGLLFHFLLAVRVGDESKVIVADLNEFSRVLDYRRDRIIAVDGDAVMRKDHSFITWVPMVLLAEGEHTLTVESGDHSLFDKSGMTVTEITIRVEAGLAYELARKDGQLVLTAK